jgi:hypothetical protein
MAILFALTENPHFNFKNGDRSKLLDFIDRKNQTGKILQEKFIKIITKNI